MEPQELEKAKEVLKRAFEEINKTFLEDEIEMLASILKALAHPIRLKICLLLYQAQNQKVCVSNIVELINTPQPNISQHLFVLKSAGILSCRRQKNWVCYQLNEGIAKKIIDVILQDKACFKEKIT